MSRKTKKSSNPVNNPLKTEINLNVLTDITKDELRLMIVDAYFEIEKEKEKRQNNETEIQRKQMEEFKKNHRIKIIRFFKLFKLRLNDKESDGRFTSAWMAMLLSIFFGGIALISILCCIALIGMAIYFVVKQPWHGFYIANNIFGLLFYLMMFVFSFVFGIFSYCTSKEVEKEKDKNYLSSVFSGIVGLAALIVAFVAVLK